MKFISALLAVSLLATTAFAQSAQIDQDKQQLKKDQAKEVQDGDKAWTDLGKSKAATSKSIHNYQNVGDRMKAQKAAQQTQNDLNQVAADQKRVQADQSKLNQTKFENRTTTIAPVVSPQPVKR